VSKLFFDSWESIFRTSVITILAYILMIFFLRISGKRTLSKMNAFDLIVTIALGSTLATVSLSKNVALADGVLAFFLLIFLQYLITFFSVRYKSIDRLVKSSPTLIAYQGRLLADTMRKERIAEDEVFSIIREKGFSSVEEVEAVVLETDGSMTVIEKLKKPLSETMNSIEKQ
jgi:uncharacterized membrane protein YcaP (DUF421 family)